MLITWEKSWSSGYQIEGVPNWNIVCRKWSLLDIRSLYHTWYVKIIHACSTKVRMGGERAKKKAGEIECFHSRGQHLCKFIGTKKSVCIRKEFISHRTGLGHQHGRRFIVLGHKILIWPPWRHVKTHNRKNIGERSELSGGLGRGRRAAGSRWHPWWELNMLTFQWQLICWRADQRALKACHQALPPSPLLRLPLGSLRLSIFFFRARQSFSPFSPNAEPGPRLVPGSKIVRKAARGKLR